MRRLHLLSLSILPLVPLALVTWLAFGVSTTASCNQGSCGVQAGDGTNPDVQLLQCGVFCVDPTSIDNCGACGNVCDTAGGFECIDSQCGCPEGQTALDGLCCDDGELNCGGACVNPLAEPNFCGAQADCQGGNAGTVCNVDSEACSDGLCCPVAQGNVDGLCCDAGQINADGLCCDAGQINADGLCCNEGQSNLGGLCCDAGQINCDGACIDPLSDNNFCGAEGACERFFERGNECNVDQQITCTNGVCLCPDGLIECDGFCIDPTGTDGFCGAQDDCEGENRGEVCVGDETCIDGLCQVP